jgi:SAM-dependent methyltransferase
MSIRFNSLHQQTKTLAALDFKGPSLRRHLIKGILVRDLPSFQMTDSIWRKQERQLFSFEPMQHLTKLELQLLKDFARLKSEIFLSSLYQSLSKASRGTATLCSSDDSGGYSNISVESVLRNSRSFYSTRCREPLSNSTITSYGSRSLDEYLSDGDIDVLSFVRTFAEKAGIKPKVLDVGSCGAQMLFDLKQALNGNVTTFALSPFDEPRLPTDFSFLKFAEYLPESFRGNFDLIFSHSALEYTVFQDLALENIAECLAVDGIAVLEWRAARAFFNAESMVDRFCNLENYQVGKIVDERLIDWLTAFTYTRNQKCGKETTIDHSCFESLDTSPPSIRKAHCLQALAFAKAVMALEDSHEFTCSVSDSERFLGGYRFPSKLEIRRRNS